jgi:peptidoglycan/LPS O-acetylase OafA/YrhL
LGTVRFLLALCVAATHASGATVLGFSLFSGVTAVQCFYVISGFLITMVLNERPEYQSIPNFYLSRYLRLWPTYILVAVLTLFFAKGSELFTLSAMLNWPALAFVIFSNVTLFFQDWFMFLRPVAGHLVWTSAFGEQPGTQLNAFLLVQQCWTLGVELTFYAIAPFVCRRWWSVALLFAFGLCSRLIVASFNPTLDPWIYRFAPSEMMMFGAGGLAYFAGRAICPRFPLATRLACTVALALFAVIVFGSDYVTPFIAAHFGAVEPLLLVTYWPVTLLMILTVAPLFYGTRHNRIDRLLGEFSYPVYVSHVLVTELMFRHFPKLHDAGNVIYILSVIVFSAALVFVVILPIDRLRRNNGRTVVYTTMRSAVPTV